MKKNNKLKQYFNVVINKILNADEEIKRGINSYQKLEEAENFIVELYYKRTQLDKTTKHIIEMLYTYTQEFNKEHFNGVFQRKWFNSNLRTILRQVYMGA